MPNNSENTKFLNDQELAKLLKAIQVDTGTIKTVADTVQFTHFTRIKENIQIANIDASELSYDMRHFLIQLAAKLKNNTISESLDEVKQYEQRQSDPEAKVAIQEIYSEIDQEIIQICDFSDKQTMKLQSSNITLQRLDFFNNLREEIGKNKERIEVLEKELKVIAGEHQLFNSI